MIQWFKKWLSYLTPMHIESVGSDVNDALELYLIQNRFRLTTMDAIYSYDDRYYNFMKAFQEISLPDDGAEVLLLGFGMGSIPFMLEKSFQRKYFYTGVELDEAVTYLFSKYQRPRIQSPIEIIQADAAVFMDLQSQVYDMICVDVFVGEFVPEHVKQDEFLENIRNALSSKGILLWNMLYATQEQTDEVDQFITFHFKKWFPDFHTIEVLGNIILFNKKNH